MKDLLPQPTSAMIARPVTLQWNGTGLPPVGMVCEVMSTTASGEWLEATIVAHDGDKAVYRLYDGSYGADPEFFEGNPSRPLFRPTRTPEQIAAEERLAVINYMEIDAGMCATAFDGDPEARVWIENLVDKGWRKAVGGAK